MMNIMRINRLIKNYKDRFKSNRKLKKRKQNKIFLPCKITNAGEEICIVGIFKNESPYIGEWIEFHRMVGFTRFILYDNGSDDRTADIARGHSLDGDVIITDWKNFNTRYSTQCLAYSHAAQNFGDQCKWMCWIDIDEFLFPIEHRPIGEILERYNKLPSIARMPSFFNEEHAHRLEAFANHAGIAIRNAQLYEQAQSAAAIEERQRLARDLHDSVSQTLFSASLIAESLPQLWERKPERLWQEPRF